MTPTASMTNDGWEKGTAASSPSRSANSSDRCSPSSPPAAIAGHTASPLEGKRTPYAAPETRSTSRPAQGASSTGEASIGNAKHARAPNAARSNAPPAVREPGLSLCTAGKYAPESESPRRPGRQPIAPPTPGASTGSVPRSMAPSARTKNGGVRGGPGGGRTGAGARVGAGAADAGGGDGDGAG